ncbi:MAG: KEOPS complex kinase/ATPase Bud32 [Nanoarchaeota archaeon]
MKQIAQGAEAIILEDKNIILKKRIPKSYRIPQLDIKLRKSRTKKECKLLEKSFSLIPVPKVLNQEEFEIQLENIKGKKLSQFLEKLKNLPEIYKQIGKNLAILHDNNIIHGDLTTSNMILKENKVYFIDFGLGFESPKAEDKAVDLHVLKEALEARHHKIAEQAWHSILQSYKQNSKHETQVLARLTAVEKRGRYKNSD